MSGSGPGPGRARQPKLKLSSFKESIEKKCIISGSVPGKGGKAAGA